MFRSYRSYNLGHYVREKSSLIKREGKKIWDYLKETKKSKFAASFHDPIAKRSRTFFTQLKNENPIWFDELFNKEEKWQDYLTKLDNAKALEIVQLAFAMMMQALSTDLPYPLLRLIGDYFFPATYRPYSPSELFGHPVCVEFKTANLVSMRERVDQFCQGDEKAFAFMNVNRLPHEIADRLPQNAYESVLKSRRIILKPEIKRIADEKGVLSQQKIFLLGYGYLYGIYFEKDPKKAYCYFETASNQVPLALYMQAIMCLEGLGVEKDQKAAQILMTKAHEAGCVFAAYWRSSQDNESWDWLFLQNEAKAGNFYFQNCITSGCWGDDDLYQEYFRAERSVENLIENQQKLKPLR